MGDSEYGWMTGAACKNSPESDLFFALEDEIQQDVIRRFCNQCKAQSECFEFAVANPRIAGYGVWGGKTSDQLKKARRRLGVHVPVEV